MEMRGSYYIFYHQVTKNDKAARFHHGSGGQDYKGCTFYFGENDSLGNQHCKDLYEENC
jgi:hypothetical protein